MQHLVNRPKLSGSCAFEFCELPWVFQRKIIECSASRKLLHIELQKLHELAFVWNVSRIEDRKFARFVKKAFLSIVAPLVTGRDWNWYIWILKKIYNGQKVWYWIEPVAETEAMITWLMDTYRIKKTFGIVSLEDLMNRLFTYNEILGFPSDSWIDNF
jgi:hypothetical protein